MVAAGMAREGAEKYATQLGLTPSVIVTTWEQHGLQESLAALREYVRLAGMEGALSATPSQIDAMANPGAMFRANGGPVSAGMPYIVGEEGYELFVPKTSGTIVPHGRVSSYQRPNGYSQTASIQQIIAEMEQQLASRESIRYGDDMGRGHNAEGYINGIEGVIRGSAADRNLMARMDVERGQLYDAQVQASQEWQAAFGYARAIQAQQAQRSNAGGVHVYIDSREVSSALVQSQGAYS
jgi:hypothetical protein